MTAYRQMPALNGVAFLVVFLLTGDALGFRRERGPPPYEFVLWFWRDVRRCACFLGSAGLPLEA
jgi:hypothetical protein